jgi:hypothetical protein
LARGSSTVIQKQVYKLDPICWEIRRARRCETEIAPDATKTLIDTSRTEAPCCLRSGPTSRTGTGDRDEPAPPVFFANRNVQLALRDAELQVYAGMDTEYQLAKKYNIKTAIATETPFSAKIAARHSIAFFRERGQIGKFGVWLLRKAQVTGSKLSASGSRSWPDRLLTTHERRTKNNAVHGS